VNTLVDYDSVSNADLEDLSHATTSTLRGAASSSSGGSRGCSTRPGLSRRR
jgi:hypothetical protein